MGGSPEKLKIHSPGRKKEFKEKEFTGPCKADRSFLGKSSPRVRVKVRVVSVPVSTDDFSIFF